jgi:hypothetical protein
VDGIAQVVQQLANDLSLILLLDPIQDRGVGRRRDRSRKTRFQIRFSSNTFNTVGAGTIDRVEEFPDSLKKLLCGRQALDGCHGK